jgi:PHP family Zn ribbon phosphoesterase
VDLHIHSALSPCSEKDMTPNNIVNMACLKGLDIIAVTDHNSMENYLSVLKCGRGKKILIVPAMEIESREEIHLLSFFSDFAAAQSMQRIVSDALMKVENREDIFGRQLVMDEWDNLKGTVKHLLLTATELGIEDIIDLVDGLGGVVIPAHVDRESNSILSNLGAIPEDLKINYLEISAECNLEEYIKKNPQLSRYHFIRSSDAHHLGDILERESFLDLEEASAACLIDLLKRK